MKNVLVCKNCKTENPIYALICSSCNSFLRSKIPNIDLWETIWRSFDSPIKAAEKIIQSETKNFLITLLSFISIKYALNAMLIHNAFNQNERPISFFYEGLIRGAVPVILILVIFSSAITLLNKKYGIANRFGDNFSIYTFAFIPQLFGLTILTPIQFALFGGYWFTFNPSPLIIKPLAATVLFFIELLLILWSGILFVTSTYCQTKNKYYSTVAGIILLFMIIIALVVVNI